MRKNNPPGSRCVSPFFFVALALGVTALLCHVIAAHNAAFANVMIGTVGAPVRALLAHVFALIPISAVELLLLLSPVLLVLLILLVRRVAVDRRAAMRLLSLFLSIPFLIYSLFVFTFATGYYATPLGERLAFEKSEPDAENLYDLSLYLAARAEEEAVAAGVVVGKEGSAMPMSYQEMNLSLIAAYDTLEERYDFIQNFAVGTKPVLLSEPMAYTHITGVYTFFTGEMNVCTAFPDFSTVFTAAHEMAHARGIAREDEANFVAFLVCEASEDPYIRYAGYMNLLQYVSEALYDTDRALYRTLYRSYSDTVYDEFRAYNACYRAHSGSVASEVAGSINNAYLSGMGTEGSVSYSLVVRLAIGYFQ